MPINKHRKRNSKQQTTNSKTTNLNSNLNSNSNSNQSNHFNSNSKSSIFTKSQHTLSAVASLTNLRNSSIHYYQSNQIKRTQSISDHQNLNQHYITHSTLSEQQSPSQTNSSFNKSDFFKRSKLSSSNSKSKSSLNLEILSTSFDSNHSFTSYQKLNHSSSSSSSSASSSLIESVINQNQIKSNSSFNQLSIKSEFNSNSTFHNQNFTATKQIENQKNSFNQKSIQHSNKKNESNQKSIEILNNKKNESNGILNNKQIQTLSNLNSLGFYSGTSTTSLSSNHSSSNHHHHTMNFSSNNNSNSNNKPVIRHMTSTSTLASTNPSINHNLFGGISKSDSNFGIFGNEVGGNGSLVLRPGDIWSQIVMRVIPLFNGEGYKGFIEDLNEFVTQHITKTISDSPSNSINKLTSDLKELFKTGISNLNQKFSSDTLTDERFLIRILEIWHFFFTGILINLESIFLPLMINESLNSVLESKNNLILKERLQQIHLLQQVSSTSGLPPSSTSLLFKTQSNPIKTQSNSNPIQNINHHHHGIDVRKLALISFRDHLILVCFNRLYKLFSNLYDDSLPNLENFSIDLISESSHLKRLQMIGLLCGTVPNEEIEALGKLIRSGKSDPKYLKDQSSLNSNSNSKFKINVTNSLSLSPTIKHWNKNREFTRRSIRRQLGNPSIDSNHHSSKFNSSNLKSLIDYPIPHSNLNDHHEIENHHHHSTTGNTGIHSLESFKFSDHLKQVVQSKINKSINYFGSQNGISLDENSSIPSPV